MAKVAKSSARKDASKTAKNKPQAAGLGIEGLGDLSSLLDAPRAGKTVSYGPRDLPLDLIDEDPNQPRTADNPGFSSKSITEIGETIKLRGVKSPISVRENPDASGRYLINHGARRYRGSKWAGKTTIPAFIDNDYNEADQVVENLQRNELTAREIADFIGRALASGKKKTEVAKEIGKSPSFVTQHITLLDMPDPIAKAFNSGRVNDVTLINELVKAYTKHTEEVGLWLSDQNQEITRGTVKLLREYLEEKFSNGASANSGADTMNLVDGNDGQGRVDSTDGKEKNPDPDKLRKAIVQVKHDFRPARLLLNRRPSSDGLAWLKYEDDGQEFEADLGVVQLVSVLEG